MSVGMAFAGAWPTPTFWPMPRIAAEAVVYRRSFAGGDEAGDYLIYIVICFTLFCRNGRYHYLRRDF
jgi:hypothetical protein